MNQLGVYCSWVNITANLSTHFPFASSPVLLLILKSAEALISALPGAAKICLDQVKLESALSVLRIMTFTKQQNKNNKSKKTYLNNIHYIYILYVYNIVCIRKWLMTKVGWTMPLTYVVGPVGPVGAYSTT